MLANENVSKVKAEKMISCVIDRVLLSPKTGLDFFVVLEEDAYFQDIAKQMRCFCLDSTKTSVNASSETSATQETLKSASSSTPGPCDSIVAEVTTSNVSKETFKAAAQEPLLSDTGGYCEALTTYKDEPSLFPFLNTKSLNVDEKRMLEGRLTLEYRRIIGKYSKVCQGIRKSLSNRGITPRQIANVVLEISAFPIRNADCSKPLLEDCKEEIENAEDIQEVFKIINVYGSFFDCYVIEVIVDSDLCTTEDKKKFHEYLLELDVYSRRNIYECPHVSSVHAGCRKLVVKVDDTITAQYTFKALDAFRAKVADTLNLQKYTPKICSVEEGCLQLTCQIPPFVKEHISVLTCEQKVRLNDLCVLKITCDDKVIFTSHHQLEDIKMTVPLALGAQKTTEYPQEETKGRLGAGRYCYVHTDGVKSDQDFFEFHWPKINPDSEAVTQCIKVTTEDADTSKRLLCRIDSNRDFEEFGSHRELKRQSSLYYIGENQERMFGRPLQAFLMEDYVKHIEKALLESLKWMHEQKLTPKLEGRFGKLCWRETSDENLSRGTFSPEEFVKLAFESGSCFFYTKIAEDRSAAVSSNFGLIDEIESYDFKLKTHHGKLDIRVKFDDGQPQIIKIKKGEHKVAIFDILCVHRHYDMRITLNNYEATSRENVIVSKFLSTLSMPKPGHVSFSTRASDDTWELDIVRHKHNTTYCYQKPKFVLTVSKVTQFKVTQEASPHQIVDVSSEKSHVEIELHNLSWDVSFGHLLHFTPEESLALCMKPQNIPTESCGVIDTAPKQWTPDWVMEDFKGKFLRMMEHLNEVLDIDS